MELAFHDAATMRRATLSCMGVWLISGADAYHDIRVGDLVASLGLDVLRKMPPVQVPGFYFVLPRAYRRLRAFEIFCNWVAGEKWEEVVG